MSLHISRWMTYEHTCPHHAEWSAVFDPKPAASTSPTLPIHPILAQTTFYFVSWMRKVLKGKYFTDVEEVKQKTAESLKGIKLTGSKTVSSSEKMSR